MHWSGCNDAVPWLNKATSRIFQPTANFENFEIHLYFVCQPVVRPGYAKCRGPEISHNKGNNENVVPKTIYPLRHGNSFYPSFPSLFFYISLARCESLPKVTPVTAYAYYVTQKSGLHVI